MLYKTVSELKGLQMLVSLGDSDLQGLYSHPTMYVCFPKGTFNTENMGFHTVSPCDATTIIKQLVCDENLPSDS